MYVCVTQTAILVHTLASDTQTSQSYLVTEYSGMIDQVTHLHLVLLVIQYTLHSYMKAALHLLLPMTTFTYLGITDSC